MLLANTLFYTKIKKMNTYVIILDLVDNLYQECLFFHDV